AKETIELSAKYANTRQQFNTPISKFPLIGKKLAEMNIQTYVLESMVYRTTGLMDAILKDIDHTSPDAGKVSAKGISEYALECSMNKV
ncbi:acyl-CoA dehydrogenase family protein, partial [Lysinibacillus sp. GbtcB16]|uniref:acyl-CoA dehydrogenase family protein n=1 Tax=Lysinibacillus sp. GbtcB16 TaxID=2824761 RepID=UPI0021133FB3